MVTSNLSQRRRTRVNPMNNEKAARKAKSVRNQILWYRLGILVVLVGIVLNINTLLFKAATFIRSELIGEQLELALITVVAVHTLISVGQGYLLIYFHKWIRQLKDS